MVAEELSGLGGHTQLGIGVDKRIDVILHLVVVIVVVVERALVGAIAVLVDKDDAVGEREISRIGARLIAIGIGVKVLGTTHFGRDLAEPSTIVQLTAIDLDEVDVVKIRRIAVLIDCPIDHETWFLTVGEIIHVTLAQERLEPVGTRCVHGDGCVRQLGAPEGEHRVLDPQGPIGLGVEGIAPDVATGRVSIVAGPADILDVADKPPAVMRHLDLVLVRLVIGHLKVGQAAVIVAALDLVPLVGRTGHTVAIHIDAHHDDARLTTASSLIGHSGALHGVAIDLHVITVLVDHWVVKAEDDVATIAAQADRTTQLTDQDSFELGVDAVLGITGLVGRKNVDKLAWSRHVVIDMGDVG